MNPWLPLTGVTGALTSLRVGFDVGTAVDDRYDLPEFLTARVDDVLSFVGVSK